MPDVTAFNDRSTPMSLLLSRRSGKARDMIAPGPDAAQMQRILTAAARVPDHGKLAPWRFVIVPESERDALAEALDAIYVAEKPDAGRVEREAVRAFARQAPALVVTLFRPRESHIPLAEQAASAVSATMTLAHGAHAEGFVSCWLTGWAAYSPAVTALFGAPGDSIVGFMFLGTAARPLEERPRPDLGEVVSVWRGASQS
ncbi:nitroreductase family protein [Sphingosinicella soli]|uniref:Putative NAD(P)H nitroreductase n=1 Tax=Sphingosinicella soli TaxID=333708 RepID=A0A7W7B302_9SPHN|nr:nitroreductase [Sphingosinicella soli]MBB4632148.1 nitroreductase [Sphingosinicella soli]